jgi:hypothetical protein
MFYKFCYKRLGEGLKRQIRFCKYHEKKLNLMQIHLIRYFGIYHKEVYCVDILCENSTSTMPVSSGEGWVFSCLYNVVLAMIMPI